MKYQFCIRFNDIDANSAASKAVLDCNKIFSDRNFKDYTFTVGDNSNKPVYYAHLLKELITFFFAVKQNSIVGIQYPLLSINNVFKHFIKLAKLKNVKFFCIVHDLESLRSGGKNKEQIALEVANLNCYDTIIVHNDAMLSWLKQAGVTKNMIPLQLFDYLADGFEPNKKLFKVTGDITYAGNLRKSTFIYHLSQIKTRNFLVYGPGFKGTSLETTNVKWLGEFSPDDIVKELSGSFGLIWDGSDIEACDEILGNYLRYNNPHKCSLYIASGLPIIAPKDSAIGILIKRSNIGILVDSLHELDTIQLSEDAYQLMKNNVLTMRQKVIAGGFFNDALKLAEAQWS